MGAVAGVAEGGGVEGEAEGLFAVCADEAEGEPGDGAPGDFGEAEAETDVGFADAETVGVVGVAVVGAAEAAAGELVERVREQFVLEARELADEASAAEDDDAGGSAGGKEAQETRAAGGVVSPFLIVDGERENGDGADEEVEGGFGGGEGGFEPAPLFGAEKVGLRPGPGGRGAGVEQKDAEGARRGADVVMSKQGRAAAAGAKGGF